MGLLSGKGEWNARGFLKIIANKMLDRKNYIL
jgi:hypothetical protein